MIHHYYVKCKVGVDWITIRTFSYKEEIRAKVAANYLCRYLNVRVYCDDEVIYECKQEY